MGEGVNVFVKFKMWKSVSSSQINFQEKKIISSLSYSNANENRCKPFTCTCTPFSAPKYQILSYFVNFNHKFQGVNHLQPPSNILIFFIGQLIEWAQFSPVVNILKGEISFSFIWKLLRYWTLMCSDGSVKPEIGYTFAESLTRAG